MRCLLSVCYIFSLINSSICHDLKGQSAPADIKNMFDEAYALESTAPEKAIAIYRQAYAISWQVGDTLNAGRSMQYIGIVFSEHDDLDSAIHYYNQALYLFKAINHQRSIGAMYTNIGNVWQFRGAYEEAINYYMESLTYFEATNDTGSLQITYNNIGSVFSFIHQPEKALSYYHTALELAQHSFDSLGIADAYVNISKLYINMNDTANAIAQLEEASQYSSSDNSYYMMLINNNLAQLYLNEQAINKALSYARISLDYARKQNTPYYLGKALITYANALIISRSFYPAIDTLKAALQIGETTKSMEIRSHAHELLSVSYERLGDYPEAHHNLMRHKQISDSIFKEKQIHSLHELEKKYQTEKKTRALAEQELLTTRQEEALNRQRLWLGVAFLTVLLLAIAAGFLIYYLYQRRHRYQQQLKLLQREQELQSVKALITGEEKERTRIAKELHDGLSGLLSSIRLRFGTFKDYFQAQNGLADYEQTLRLLDEAGKEVRQISHNLMPEILLKFGLIEALNSYFSTINQSKALQIDFQVLGLEERLPSSLALTLYRIIQELINNIIKHSNATEVMVQLNRMDNLLAITVEDNGQGFSLESSKEGLGLDSIRSRVDYLSGKLDIQSKEGMGTSVYIEFMLEKAKAV